MPASSTRAFPHLHHDVYEHVRDGAPPFCGRARDHGKSVHVRHIRVCLRVCGRGCDPQCISKAFACDIIRSE